MRNEFSFSTELLERSREIMRENARQIKPKVGTAVASNQFICIAGKEKINRLKKEASEKTSANNERYSVKTAKELNAPIEAELQNGIQVTKDTVRKLVNDNLDARIKRIDETRVIPIRSEAMGKIQTFKMLIDMGAEIPQRDWELLMEHCAGHYLEEKAVIALAKSKDILIIPSTDLDKSAERIETFREMANKAIDKLDNPDDSLASFAFFNERNEALNTLMDEIDTDVSSMIPAERLTVLQRLKDAQEHARNKDDYSLSAKIGIFIDRNMERLATPEELNDALYSEAEDFIKQGMSAGAK